MKNFIVTFGFGQIDVNGHSLGNCYALIPGENEAEARKNIFKLRGGKWAFLYDSKFINEKDGSMKYDFIERFGLSEVPIKQICLAGFEHPEGELVKKIVALQQNCDKL